VAELTSSKGELPELRIHGPADAQVERAQVDGPSLRAVRESMSVPLRRISRTAGMSHGHLSKVERGEYGRPVTPAILNAYEQVLGVKINVDLINDATMLESTRHKATWRPGELGPFRRRNYIANVGMLCAGGVLDQPYGRLVDSAGTVVEPNRLGIPEAGQLAQMAETLATLDLRHAGTLAGPLAFVLVRWSARLLVLVRPDDPASGPLHAAVSLVTLRAAWWKVDIGQHDAGRTLFRMALFCATQSFDADLRARVLADIAAHHACVGYGYEALDILRFAQGDERVSPEVQTLLAEVRQRALDAEGVSQQGTAGG
jgi:transcriptional regulator with XRE-family HTH domain